MTSTVPRVLDLLDGDFYAGDPDQAYAWLRSHAPLYRDEINQLWGVSRHHDVVAIERDAVTFCSSQGYRPNLPSDNSMIGDDDPRHHERRRLVARRFTPNAVSRHEDHVRSVVTGLLDAVAAEGRCEVVEDLAAPLPAKVIGRLLGFPDDQWQKVKYWSEATIVAGGGPRYISDGVATAFGDYCAHAAVLAESRRAAPTDDVMSVWTGAEADGVLTLEEVLSEGLLLVDGGAETTRTVITGAVLALIEHPDQYRRLIDDPGLLPVAVEEFIRWVTPILNMRRTATRDTEVAGAPVRAGDELLLMYSSANRDEDVFGPTADRFDVGRDPNPHIAFGFGTHFCLGAALARLEIRVMFEELLPRLRDLRLAPGTRPERVPNAFVRGFKSLPVEFTPG
ncbi:MAG: cytochrome P450 [Actinobacteria bacterium]|nr:cytochrome P450 [Actinomycetota bacterium]